MTAAGKAGEAAKAGEAENAEPPFGDWLVDQPHWEVYFLLTWAACVAIVQAGPISTSGRIIAGAALLAMAPWYIWVGRPAMEQPDLAWQSAAIQRGSLYLTGLLILFAVSQALNPNTWFLAFVICPQCFAVTNPRSRSRLRCSRYSNRPSSAQASSSSSVASCASGALLARSTASATVCRSSGRCAHSSQIA